jgi:outer membrane protein OmpA-like peptidoglycan-associated protein
MRTRKLAYGLGAASLLSLLTNQAHAQNLALDRFDPSMPSDRMFGVPSAYVPGELALHAMILGDYAHNPLVLRTVNNGDDRGSVVKNQLFLHLAASLALWNRLEVGVDVPFALAQSGDDPTGFASPSSAQIGDLKIGARLALIGQYHSPFQLAVGGSVWLPTGGSGYVSDGKVRGMPQLIASGQLDRFVWSAMVAPEFRVSQQVSTTTQGSQMHFGAGVGVYLDQDHKLQIGPEMKVSFVVEDVQKRTLNAEALLDVRYRFLPFMEAGIGLGPGLSSGVGTPDFRAVAMLAYSPEPELDRDHDGILDADDACPDVKGVRSDDPKKNGCPPPSDRDGDGIFDDQDACPDVKGIASDDPKKNGCPPPSDRDGDGIFDDKDACPDVKGIANDDPKKNGCPPPSDRDGDGIIDDLDACPDVKGVPDQDPKKNGCPPDTDGDGILDDKDACPNEKGKPDPDPKKNGCPTSVVVTDNEIFILQQVQFDTDKSTIKSVSDALLDEVAGVLKDHGEINKIEVQGHTDDRGGKAHNKKLSQDRADAVKTALVKRGIDAARLTAMGYGQDVPVAENKTPEGRAKNRRVQFKILEKKPKK